MAKVSVKGTTAPSETPKKKKSRPAFNGALPNEMNETKELVVAKPASFDYSKFKPLKSKLFASKALHLEHLALYHEWKASDLRARAKDPSIAKTKRIDKQVEKMVEFIEELKKAGQDTTKFEKLLAAAKGLQEAD